MYMQISGKFKAEKGKKAQWGCDFVHGESSQLDLVGNLGMQSYFSIVCLVPGGARLFSTWTNFGTSNSPGGQTKGFHLYRVQGKEEYGVAGPGKQWGVSTQKLTER